MCLAMQHIKKLNERNNQVAKKNVFLSWQKIEKSKATWNRLMKNLFIFDHLSSFETTQKLFSYLKLQNM